MSAHILIGNFAVVRIVNEICIEDNVPIYVDAHASSEYVLHTATRLARKKFDIESSTIQIERELYSGATNNILESEFCLT